MFIFSQTKYVQSSLFPRIFSYLGIIIKWLRCCAAQLLLLNIIL